MIDEGRGGDIVREKDALIEEIQNNLTSIGTENIELKKHKKALET